MNSHDFTSPRDRRSRRFATQEIALELHSIASGNYWTKILFRSPLFKRIRSEARSLVGFVKIIVRIKKLAKSVQRTANARKPVYRPLACKQKCSEVRCNEFNAGRYFIRKHFTSNSHPLEGLKRPKKFTVLFGIQERTIIPRFMVYTRINNFEKKNISFSMKTRSLSDSCIRQIP